MRILGKIILLMSLPITVLAGPPDFPHPPDARVEWVGKNMQINGLPTSIRAFHTRKSIEQVVEFYRREWQRPVERDKPGFMETIDAYPWYIISRIEDDYLLTVQVQVKQNDKSGSWGYLSVSPLVDPKTKPPELGKGIPKMPGSHILTENTSNDPGKKARTLIITNDHSVPSNVSFYRNHFNGKGWTKETDKALGTDKVHSLVFKTKRDRVTMMFLKDKDYTRIVINSVTNSLF
ncbi:MAG: hypothetical protein RLT87_11730 [Gammaproteobacteria bacterium]